MRIRQYIKRLATLALMAASLALPTEAWGQVTGDQYEPISTVISINSVSAGGDSTNGHGAEKAIDGDHSSYWQSKGNGNIHELSFTVDNYQNIQSIVILCDDDTQIPSAVTIRTRNRNSGSWTFVKRNLPMVAGRNVIYLDDNSSFGQYIQLRFTRENGTTVRILEVSFLGDNDMSTPTIQHKPAKWYDQRVGGNYVDTFDDEVATDGKKGMIHSGDGTTLIQAAHTLVDTIYMHRGETVTLTLPDRLDNDYSIKTYQRWYDFRTEKTFEVNNHSVEGAPYDLLTPNNGLTGYRFSNGYVGSPLAGTGARNVLSSMSFYYPETTETDRWFGTDYDDSWFLVACDVSGYTDYTQSYSADSKNSDFSTPYYEPTLSHRIIYYICEIDDNKKNWYASNIATATDDKDKYMEEYNITMPATRIPNYTEEMIALSKDARSFSVPGGDIDGEVSVSLDDSNNSAGIDLITDALSGEQRVIHFTYPTRNSDGTYSVNGSTATILVEKNGYNLARYNLTFEEDFRLLTQTQVETYNDPDLEASADTFQFRMPNYLNENYILLNELNFDYDQHAVINGYQNGIYSFPMDWDFSTYAFYDGGVVSVAEKDNNNNITGWRLGSPADFEGGNRPYPEWGYYGILSQYVESGGWAWGSSTNKNAPRDDMAIRYNSLNKRSTYHLYADVSDRPGVVARLPFETDLCAGSELYVTAWVKSARGGAIKENDNNNAAMLFTIMGVTTGDDGREVYTPIYRYQTGQIPVTYSNDKGVKVPGFDAQDNGGYRNDWFQVYFSFINSSSDLNYERYVLQIDNNSAATRGGDMYLDDVRVYLAPPLAEVTQRKSACSTDRTLLSLSLDRERLLARVGSGILTDGEDGKKYGQIGVVLVDTLLFRNNFNGNDYGEAILASAVDLGISEEESYHSRVLNFYGNFDDHKEYDEDGINLASANDHFFYRNGTAAEDNSSLITDFYGDLTPGRTYWLLLYPYPEVNTIEVSDGTDTGKKEILIIDDEKLGDYFADFDTDRCAIKADFKVTGDVTLKVDGEIVTPKTEFCRGNVRNFTIDLKIPGLSNPTDSITITNGIYFDWFFGEVREGMVAADPETQYTEKVVINDAGQLTVDEENGVSLREALTIFRNIDPSATTLEAELVGKKDTDGNEFTREMYDVIDYYLNAEIPVGAQNRPLVLHQSSLSVTLLETMRMVVQPIPMSIGVENLPGGYDEEKWLNLCWGYTYLELKTTGEAPSVYPGFNTVQYPNDLAGQSIRIGLEQIQSVSTEKSDSLTVDLRDARSHKPDNESFILWRVHDTPDQVSEQYSKLYLTNTDDPDMKAFIDEQGDAFDDQSLPIGTVDRFEAHHYEAGGTEYTNQMKIRFNLSQQTVLINGAQKSFTFVPREGYYYTFNVYFEEQTEQGDNTACYGRFPLTLKVVPKYLVWNDTQKSDDYSTIGNWNNDDNWQRVASERIQAEDKTSDYFTDGENENTGAFVPMLFSKVIMPRNSKVQLYAAGYGENGKWNNSARPDNIAEPTPNIQYDLMAFEHTGETAGGAGVQEGDLKTERYRVSLLNQIHFEPGAEMLHAEYLLYDTAWVDYELTGGRWYTLASPLKAVYAGDFYTDKSGTEGNEYFQPIYYSESDNSRFNPSVYQRGWKGNATLQTLNSGTKDVAISGNWSALYNDVAEAYTPGTGFSLKVQDVTGNATFRLPKADGSYKYYPYGDGQSDNETSVSRVEGEGEEEEKVSGRLQSDQLFIRNTDIDKADKGAPIEITLSETAHGDYYLVGNPFMAHLDMEKFFEKQTFNDITINNGEVLEWKYWYLDDDGTQVAVSYDEDKAEWISDKENDNFLIPPLRSFFVVKNAEVENNVIKFTQEMQTLGGTGDGLRSANALTITATTTDGRTSRAAVAYSGMASDDYQSSEDAELFLDSNLGDVPMVYTVAGTMASSINVRQNCELVPLGVYGARNEQVTLRFDQVGVFSGVKLYDTKTKRYTTLTEGSEVSVSTNDYGRYYLTGGIATGNEAIRSVDDISIYSVRSGEIVATSAGSSLRSVRVYGIGGELVAQQSLANQSVYRLRVPGNAIYVVYAEDMDGIIRNVKLRVR